MTGIAARWISAGVIGAMAACAAPAQQFRNEGQFNAWHGNMVRQTGPLFQRADQALGRLQGKGVNVQGYRRQLNGIRDQLNGMRWQGPQIRRPLQTSLPFGQPPKPMRFRNGKWDGTGETPEASDGWENLPQRMERWVDELGEITRRVEDAPAAEQEQARKEAEDWLGMLKTEPETPSDLEMLKEPGDRPPMEEVTSHPYGDTATRPGGVSQAGDARGLMAGDDPNVVDLKGKTDFVPQIPTMYEEAAPPPVPPPGGEAVNEIEYRETIDDLTKAVNDGEFGAGDWTKNLDKRKTSLQDAQRRLMDHIRRVESNREVTREEVVQAMDDAMSAAAGLIDFGVTGLRGRIDALDLSKVRPEDVKLIEKFKQTHDDLNRAVNAANISDWMDQPDEAQKLLDGIKTLSSQSAGLLEKRIPGLGTVASCADSYLTTGYNLFNEARLWSQIEQQNRDSAAALEASRKTNRLMEEQVAELNKLKQLEALAQSGTPVTSTEVSRIVDLDLAERWRKLPKRKKPPTTMLEMKSEATEPERKP